MAESFMPFFTKRQPLTMSARERRGWRTPGGPVAERNGRCFTLPLFFLDSASGISDNAVLLPTGVNRHTVALCVRKFFQFGLEAALGDLSASGQESPHPGRCSCLGVALCLSEAEGAGLLI